VMAGTRYADLLGAGLQAFQQSGRLSSFERQLKHYRLNWMAGLIARDPLGIGVVIGYLALKTNEINNLRWIAQGIRHGLPTGTIRAEMEYAG